jgi:hypothetical protein
MVEEHTTAPVFMWLMSAVTPGVLTTSYRWSTETSGFIFISSESGWPIPPDAPRTATLNPGAAPFARQFEPLRMDTSSICKIRKENKKLSPAVFVNRCVCEAEPEGKSKNSSSVVLSVVHKLDGSLM